MELLSINENNLQEEHICCAIGADKANQSRAQSKKDWMKARFKDGLVFKRFDERGKMFVEYMPIEKVWKPIIGKNYIAINCLWVSGKFQGQGLAKQLLDECINDTKKQNKDGIVIVTSTKKKGFLTDKKFFTKFGFQTIDTAPPYFELLLYKLNDSAKEPYFSNNAKKGICPNQNGFTFIYSNQCPFMDEYVNFMGNIVEKRNIPREIIKLKNYKEAQKIGSPFGTLGIYYNGEFKNHELMAEKKFEKFLDSLVKTS